MKGLFWRTYPRSGFRSGGTCERSLVPVFVPGEHPPKPPFWKPPFCRPCPTYQLWPFSFPPENPPKTLNMGSRRITRTEGFCGNSTENLNFPEFPGPSRFRILGSPFSAFWGEMKLTCWAALTLVCSSERGECDLGD